MKLFKTKVLFEIHRALIRAIVNEDGSMTCNKSEQNGKLTEKRNTKPFRSEHFINLIIRAVGLWWSWNLWEDQGVRSKMTQQLLEMHCWFHSVLTCRLLHIPRPSNLPNRLTRTEPAPLYLPNYQICPIVSTQHHVNMPLMYSTRPIKNLSLIRLPNPIKPNLYPAVSTEQQNL